MLDCHRLLTNATIPQDDRIEDVTTLHAPLCGTLQLASAVYQVHGDFVHHETAASHAG
jgi:hypothetical protein